MRETKPSPVLLGLGLLGGISFLVGLTFQMPFLQLASKPFPMLALMVWLRQQEPSRYRDLVFWGFIFSLGGDVLLEMQVIYTPWKAQWFLAGLVSFLIAHLFYIRAYLEDSRALAIVPASLAFAFGIGMFVLIYPGVVAQKMSIPVAFYVLVLSSMLWRAGARLGQTSLTSFSANAGMIGASLFVVSDSLIAINKFYSPFEAARYLIILLYWAGQVGIGASILGRSSKASA